jgi:hypothetical protein
VPLRRHYEGFLDDTFGKSFCPLLIDRIAFGSQHSGSYQFDVGQRPAKSLGSWTPFRLQKIGYTEFLHTHPSRSFSWDPPLLFFIHLPSFRFLASSLILFFLFSIRFCFRRCLSPRRRLRSGKIVKIVGVILHASGINPNLYFVHHKWRKRKVSDSIAEFPDTNNNGAHVHRGRHGQCLSCQ